jgi:hypothetical protein
MIGMKAVNTCSRTALEMRLLFVTGYVSRDNRRDRKQVGSLMIENEESNAYNTNAGNQIVFKCNNSVRVRLPFQFLRCGASTGWRDVRWYEVTRLSYPMCIDLDTPFNCICNFTTDFVFILYIYLWHHLAHNNAAHTTQQQPHAAAEAAEAAAAEAAAAEAAAAVRSSMEFGTITHQDSSHAACNHRPTIRNPTTGDQLEK